MPGLLTLAVRPAQPGADAVREAVRQVRNRRIVAAPTDTLYGLLADGTSNTAVARVFRAKRRPRERPVPLLLESTAAVRRVAAELPRAFHCLAGAFWPGALTIVVPAGPSLPELVTGGRGSVAVRVPRSALIRAIARQARCPLTGTSANLSGRKPPRTAAGVAAQIGPGLALLLDGGPVRRAVPSTIVGLTGQRPAVLRDGVVGRARIDAALRRAFGSGLA